MRTDTSRQPARSSCAGGSKSSAIQRAEPAQFGQGRVSGAGHDLTVRLYDRRHATQAYFNPLLTTGARARYFGWVIVPTPRLT
jgi:hypothetical protein